MERTFTPLEKATDELGGGIPYKADGGLKLSSPQTVRERSSLILKDRPSYSCLRNGLTGFTIPVLLIMLTNFAFSSFCAEPEKTEGVLLIRQAKQDGKTTVAVEVYLTGNIIEAKVIARMYATKPTIYNIILVGPNIGRVSPITKEALTSLIEEEAPFETTERGAFIEFTDRTKDKKSRGTLTRELVKIKVPSERMISGKRYQLWIKVESAQRGGQTYNFKFDLKNLAELILNNK